MRVGFIHQTFPPSKRDSDLLVSRHVSRGQICQEHFPKCSLHCGFQEPEGSIGSPQCTASIVSYHVERQFGDLSSGHDTSLLVFGLGFAPHIVRSTTVVEPCVKRRGMDANVSKASQRFDLECQPRFVFGRYPGNDENRVEGYRDCLPPCFGLVGKKSWAIIFTACVWTTWITRPCERYII